MTNKLIEAHGLYPKLGELKWGDMYNDDPFFTYWAPEDLQNYLLGGWKLEGKTKVIRGLEVPHVECFDHDECWTYAIADAALGFECCETQLEFNIQRKIEEQKSKNINVSLDVLTMQIRQRLIAEYEETILEHFHDAEIISADQIKQKIAGAQASSPFFHPFECHGPVKLCHNLLETEDRNYGSEALFGRRYFEAFTRD